MASHVASPKIEMMLFSSSLGNMEKQGGTSTKTACLLLIMMNAAADVAMAAKRNAATANGMRCSWQPTNATLQCVLHVGEGSRTSVTFSRHQRESTKTLRLFCDDGMPTTTSKRAVVNFDVAHWPHLDSLQISGCQVLTASSKHKDILSSVVKPLLGGHIRGLRHLDLSGNQLSTFRTKSQVWCELGVNLQTLNVSNNLLTTVPSIMLEQENKDCQLAKLEWLDLSHNKISQIEPVNNVPSLLNLLISYNSLQHIQANSLKRLKQLQVLDLSENRLTHLPQDLSIGSHIRELYLQGNNLDQLPSLQVLQPLSNLVLLNLSRNDIVFKDSDDLSSLTKLVALDMSHNKLTHVSSGLLKKLTSLQVLSLGHNQIRAMASESLVSLASLHVLVLSHNDLDDLPGDLLNGLSDLRSLSLDHNRIRLLHSDLLRNCCSSIKDLSLSANFIRHWPSVALRPLGKSLRTLDMGENNLRELKENALEGFEELYGLRLAGNRLRNLSANTFFDNVNIRMLNLAHNLLEVIDQNAFATLKKLKALRLDDNRLEDINGLLTVQHHLQWLNVSHNQLQWFDYAFIPKSLVWLSLRHNRIEELGNYYDMQEGFHLVHMDVGHNRLVRIDRQALQSSLQTILADHNDIFELAANTFSDLTNLTLVNLTHNQLEKFPFSALAISLNHGSTRMHLSGNPLVCDCEMEWLQRINRLADTSPREFPKIIDWSELQCRLNNRDKVSSVNGTVSLFRVQANEFLCPYETHCFALCMCCQFLACDCRMKCSDGCACYHDQTWSSNIIECGNRGHDVVPEFIPMDATALYLDGNNFGQAVANDEFIGRKHLTSLFLNDSGVTLVTNKTFNGLTELLSLHLENNGLTSLASGGEFDELVSLTDLYLHENLLEFIHADTFAPLVNLHVLTLHGNRLTVDFPVWTVFTASLKSLTIGSNRWNCQQCDFVQKVQSAMSTHRHVVVKDYQNVKCLNDTRNNGGQNVSCADVLAVSFRSGQHEWTWDSLVPVVAIIAAAIVIVTSLIILAVAARKPVTSWFHAKYGSVQLTPVTGTRQPQNNYDVLVHSSPVDEEFVRQTIVSRVETSRSPSLRVCVHSNKGHTGSWQSLLDSSATALVVVSQSYMQQNYSDISSLVDVCSKQKKPVILVALDSATSKDLKLLKPTVLLLWDTKSFWPSLMSALPKAANNKYEEDMWTYLKADASLSGGPSGDSSLSTQSTDNGMTLPVVQKRSATLTGRGGASSQLYHHHQESLMVGVSSPATLHSRRMQQRQMAGAKNIRENPLGPYSDYQRRRQRQQQQQQHQNQQLSEEPIYHTLDEQQLPGGGGGDKSDSDVTVYINADLEVVYPTLPLKEDQEDEELSGLLSGNEDCYENGESLFGSRQNGYVPSPAPGSYPRNFSTSLSSSSPGSGKNGQGQIHHSTASRHGYYI